MRRAPRSPPTPITGAWKITSSIRLDYQLNTQTGNRPPRGATTSKTTVPPVYVLSGLAPNKGENYRVALARMTTQDFQFARAAVNYIWEYFFTRRDRKPFEPVPTRSGWIPTIRRPAVRLWLRAPCSRPIPRS